MQNRVRQFPAFGRFDLKWLVRHPLIQGTIADTSIMAEMYRKQKEETDGKE